MWKLRLFALLCMGSGVGLLLFGVYLEFAMREHRGRGFRRFLGNVFYSGHIDTYRETIFHSLLFAPGLIVSGVGVWAFVSWRKRVRQARRIEQGLLQLKPAARKRILERGLSGRKLVRELDRIEGGGKN